MELLNGTENRIKELDKNVWGYCIMEKTIETLTSQVIQLRYSPDDTELQRIQTEFEKYVKSLSFFNKITYSKSIKIFEDTFKDTKNQIEIDKLEKYINDYRTENQKLINNNNCSEDENQEQINKIFETGELVINHYTLFKSNNLSKIDIDKINKLIDSFQRIKKQTTKIYENHLIKCEKNKIIKDGNYKVVDKRIPLIENTLYYRYNSKDKLVSLLGQYKGTRRYSIRDDKDLNVFIFEKDGETVEIDADKDKEFLIKEKEINVTFPGTPGGKPKKSRRQKNKKRRSSRRKN